ncbi:MAG TPA: hypothetical protein VE640_09810 [Candidatus Bathyarchaeia archaeon]|jgi:hypothetical protein|nr:hypothetical protein [Candidatus Bathyarchaeia archaeon]
MIIFSGLLTAFGRMIGAAATMTIAWATILLFGRIPQSKRTVLSFITLGSLAWVAALAGVVFPTIGSFFIAAVPRTDLIQISWLRIGMLFLAALLPLAIGFATVNFVEPKARPVGRDRYVEALRGYPYAATYAITIVFLAGWALSRKIRSMQRGWESAHIPMIVKPRRYEAVVADFETALRKADLPVTRKQGARGLKLPLWLLSSVGGEKVRGEVPAVLAVFEADDLNILVYPSDVALLGRADLVSAARAAIARRLAFADAYFTSTMESEQIEDRLREISKKPSVTPKDFEAIDEQLTTLEVPYDEWETLYRLRLQVEQERRLPDRTAPAEAA